MKTKMLLYLLL